MDAEIERKKKLLYSFLIPCTLLQDYELSCTMNGHKSVVSSLAVCNEVLYSGSWDGTVRLWCLSNHSPLAVLGESTPGNLTSVLSIAADEHTLVAAHENGIIKVFFQKLWSSGNMQFWF